MKTDEMINGIAKDIADFIQKRIDGSLEPFNILLYMVDKKGMPVIDYEHPYNPCENWEEKY